MVPAHVLAQELTARGHHVALVTDERGLAYPGLFTGVPRHVIESGTISLRKPLRWLPAVRAIAAGRAQALRLYDSFAPSAVIGFGGYPVLPAMLAAKKLGIPTIIHEQNAVLGRVNRLLARRVDAIATAYPDIERLPRSAEGKVTLVGNPVRQEVLDLREQPYPELSEDSIFRVLVIGGSQGAQILSDVVPEGLGMLPPVFRRRLQVTQQCREEDIDRVRQTYSRLAIPAECATYLEDLPDRLGWAHLVIARAGASTVAEVGIAGRPAILVPLPTAMDDHQTANAQELVESGGARMIRQDRFTFIELGKQMQKLGLEPAGLRNAASRARETGRPDAAKDLADLVERMSDGADVDLKPAPVEAPAFSGGREAFA